MARYQAVYIEVGNVQPDVSGQGEVLPVTLGVRKHLPTTATYARRAQTRRRQPPYGIDRNDNKSSIRPRSTPSTTFEAVGLLVQTSPCPTDQAMAWIWHDHLITGAELDYTARA